MFLDVFNHDDGIMQVNDPNKLCLEDQSLSVNCSENSYQLTSLRVTNKGNLIITISL